MSDPRALLDAYAEVPNMNVIQLPFTPGHMAPLAFAALRAVLDLHVNDMGDCRECGVDAVEEPIPWPCATVRAITTALEAS